MTGTKQIPCRQAPRRKPFIPFPSARNSEEYTVYEVDVPDGGHMEEDEDILNYDDLDDPDTFV